MTQRTLVILAVLCLQATLSPVDAIAQGKGRGKGGSGLGNYTVPPPANNVPEHLYNIVLGRPTDSSITIRTLFHQEVKVFIEYGLESGTLTQKTPVTHIAAKFAYDFELKSLNPNQRYYYRLVYTDASDHQQSSDVYTFHTQRAPGSSFVFTVTSDSHLDENLLAHACQRAG